MGGIRAPADRTGRTWDLCVRVTHWCVAAIVVWNTFGPTDRTHRVLGYVAMGMVFGRLLWGFCGSRNARFSTWWPTRKRLKRYVQSLFSSQPLKHESHNPLGGLMAITLWAIVLALGCSGFLMRTDAMWGEAWPQELHVALSVALQGCVVVHILAAMLMSVWTRKNLIGAMIFGGRREK